MKPANPFAAEKFYAVFASLLLVLMWLSYFSGEILLAAVLNAIIGGIVVWRILEVKKIYELQRKQGGYTHTPATIQPLRTPPPLDCHCNPWSRRQIVKDGILYCQECGARLTDTDTTAFRNEHTDIHTEK